MRVLQGPLRGAIWEVGSGPHGYWLGSYESHVQAAMVKWVRPGEVAFDIGANVGFLTILASRLVGPAGRVVAFEPEPRNLERLRRHCDWNGAANVRIIEAAVSSRSGKGRLGVAGDQSSAGLDPRGEIDVTLVAIDELVQSHEIPPPEFMKVDVEGHELDVLRGARRTIEESQPVIVLAAHGSARAAECRGSLEAGGYGISWLGVGMRSGLGEMIAIPASRRSGT
jgi:FkbM family methyltransferase